ncbi:hypothetical protein ACIPJO_16525 [Streptomyces sp. NPDC086993]|uniref:hypothetical protein n=1 Tax=Streptomyces sp. NPDC086993 TaxID=3365765 RepID=UPI0038016250
MTASATIDDHHSKPPRALTLFVETFAARVPAISPPDPEHDRLNLRLPECRQASGSPVSLTNSQAKKLCTWSLDHGGQRSIGYGPFPPALAECGDPGYGRDGLPATQVSNVSTAGFHACAVADRPSDLGRSAATPYSTVGSCPSRTHSAGAWSLPKGFVMAKGRNARRNTGARVAETGQRPTANYQEMRAHSGPVPPNKAVIDSGMSGCSFEARGVRVNGSCGCASRCTPHR